MTIKNLLVLTFLLGAYLGFGQFGKPQVIFGRNPHQVVNADLNSDGNVDIIALLREEDSVSKIVWFENEGRGSFSISKQIVNQAVFSSIEVTDFDEDGDKDILFALEDDIVWVANNGNGNFSLPITLIKNASNISQIIHEDLDNDGDKDIFSISPEGDVTLSWYENDGQNNFLTSQIISTRNQGKSGNYLVVDLDLDGDYDIIQSLSDRGLYWYENDGNGNFPIPTEIYRLSSAEIAASDLDMDGDIDIVAANNATNIFLYENNGDNTFTQRIILEGGNQFTSLRSVVLADLNDDGNLDVLVVPNSTKGLIFWLSNNGNNTFSTPNIIDITDFGESSDYNITQILADDIDNDNDMDVVSVSISNDRISWYKNFSRAALFTENLIMDINTLRISSNIIFEDLDGDNRTDILTFTPGGDKIMWYKNEGLDKFYKSIEISNRVFGISGICMVDIDQDGDLDIFAASNDGSRIEWFRNLGNGRFSAKIVAARNVTRVCKLYAADLDDDGDLDIVSTTSDDRGGINWHENDGNGNLISSIEISNYKGCNIELADIDADGDIDILREELVYRNDGDGSFSEIERLLDELGEIRFKMADIDEDNDIDYIIFKDDSVIAYRNDGTAIFTEYPIFVAPPTYEVVDVEIVDMDKDNDLDIFVSTTSEEEAPSNPSFLKQRNQIYFLENNDSNNFLEKIIYEEDAKAQASIYIVDLDNDGDLDLLSSSRIFWGVNLLYHGNLTDSPIIQGVFYFDKNSNGIFDSTEMTLSNIPITLSPNTLSSYTDANGTYRFYVPNGTYTLSVQPDSCYQLTTDSLSYTVTIDGNVALNKNFGFQLASDYQHTQTRINSAPTRCGFEVPFSISVQNDGCVPSQGQYGLVLDSLVTLVEATIEPSEIRGDTLLWNYDELFSTQSTNIKLTLQIAGTEFLGDFIHLTGLSYIENEVGELALSSTYNYTSEIRCAYDPNDKLVYPNRLGDYDKNYTLFEEELEYTVRFQNTGTDTAFMVVIKDYLDPNLNWKTFKPVVSSHPHETLLHPDGLVEFTFKNILLPDSTTNEPLSHGFVTYKIKPNADLEENTNIENTANIFFDFNPPIETNTTSNVLVEELPKATATRQFTKTDFPLKVYPNPFEEILTFELEQFQPAVLEIFDARGKLVRTSLLQDRVHQESVSHLPSGLYFYRLLERDKHQLLASGRMVKQ